MARRHLTAALLIAGIAAGAGSTGPEGAGETTKEAGPWRAPPGTRQLPIWPGRAPDGTYRPQPGESVETFVDPPAPGGASQAVSNVSVPTMTVVLPKGRPTRTAVVVFPGGGFRKLFVDIEGTEICAWLTGMGVTCVISKYRVPGSDDFWDAKVGRQVTPAVPRALQDAQRTIRLVRSMAGDLGINPHRVGVLGMSAGGYLVAQTSNLPPAYRAVDAVDRTSSRPDFAIALYPGHICRDGRRFDPTLAIGHPPPTFIAQAWNDETDPVCNSLLYAAALDRAGVPTELHLFARGGHAFALRHPREPVGAWPRLAEAWLRQIGML